MQKGTKIAKNKNTEPEDEENSSLFGQFMNEVRGHKKGHKKHHRGGMPRVEADDEDLEEGSFQHKGHEGHRRPHHRRRHHGGCVVVHLFGVALLGAHFFFIRRLGQAQVAVEKITGKKECKKSKNTPVVIQQQTQQPVIVEYAPVNHSTESSLEEIVEDKEMGMTYAPNPTGIQFNQNQMV